MLIFHRIGICLSLFTVCLSLTGCMKTTGSASDNEGYSFTDSLGMSVSVSQPQKTAALMGGFADVWLLAGGSLTAVTDDAFTQRELSLEDGTANLGLFNNPSLEALIVSGPDLVLLSSETPAHVALQGTLKNAGITAAYFNVTHFSDYLNMLDICTSITGRKDLYMEHGLLVEARINEILENIPAEEAPTVLLLITHSQGAYVQREDTMTGQMLSELGAVNIAGEDASILKEMNIERIMVHNPDFIFIIPMGNSDELAEKHLLELIQKNPAWEDLRAVKNGRCLLLPKELFLFKPNAAWDKSYHYLYEVLYGKK